MAGPLLYAQRMTAVTIIQNKFGQKSGSLAKEKIKSSCWISVNYYRLKTASAFCHITRNKDVQTKSSKDSRFHSSNQY